MYIISKYQIVVVRLNIQYNRQCDVDDVFKVSIYDVELKL